MKRRKLKVKEFDYAGTFDRLMGEQFGEAFATSYSIFSMGYQTYRSKGRSMTKKQALYGRGLSQGMNAYREFSEPRSKR